MQLVARQAFTEKGFRTVVSTPYPGQDSEIYGNDVCRSPRRDPVLGPVLVTLALLGRLFAPRGARLFAPDHEGRLMTEANLVVDLSGDMLTEDSGISAAVSHFLPLLRAWALGTPYAVAPQSIGPFRRTKTLARFLLSRAVVVMSRDPITEGYLLDELGLPRSKVVHSADLAFLLIPSANMSSLTETVPTPRVGVSLSAKVEERYGRAGGSDFVAMMASAIDGLHKELGLWPILFAHVTGPSADKDDRLILRRVAQRMNSPVRLIDHDLEPSEIKGAIGTCDFFMGARMHANIAALSQGIPTTALSYSHKSLGIMASLGQEDLVLDVETLDEGVIIDTVRRMVDSAELRRADLRRASLEHAKSARDAVELLVATA